MLKAAVVFHHPESEGAIALAREVVREFERRSIPVEFGDAWAPGDWATPLSQAGIVICIGGDGTVLRAARLGTPYEVPLLGVNMGRLGFLTDMSPGELFSHFERIVAMDWRLEERVMVHGEISPTPADGLPEYDGLNDIVLSRRSPGRPIYVDVRIDGEALAIYRCDSIIVSTPTGSTGYSLSAGGPIMAPTEHHLVVTPVSAHLALGRSIVLPYSSVVELRVTSDHGAIVSVDGQDDLHVTSETVVTLGMSKHVTRFVRFDEPSSFFGRLAEKLEFQLSSAMNQSQRA